MTRMLSKYIPALTGWQAVLAVLLGAFVLYVSGRLIAANVDFSAISIVEMTGGQVVIDQSNVYSPAVKVIRGGVIGLELALLGGALFSVIQFIFWLTAGIAAGGDRDEWEDGDDLSVLESVWNVILSFKRNPFPLVFGASMCVDVIATWYYLNVVYTGNDESVLAAALRLSATLFITFLFFSFGSELWATVGWELVHRNWPEAARVLVEDWQFGLAPLAWVFNLLTAKPSARGLRQSSGQGRQRPRVSVRNLAPAARGESSRHRAPAPRPAAPVDYEMDGLDDEE